MKKFVSLLMVLATLFSCLSVFGTPVSAAVISSNALLPFEDVSEDRWYAYYAEFCYANEIITGQGNSYTFAPNVELTRATFVVMLARVMKADLSVYKTSAFSDCGVGSWYTPSVMWAFTHGYVNGTGNGKFSPNKTLTREEAAVLFQRLISSGDNIPENTASADGYTDMNKVSSWARSGVKYIIEKGVMSSTSTKNLVFSPKAKMTRAQIAKVLYTYMVDFSWCRHRTRTEPSCVKGDWCRSCGIKFTLPMGHQCNSLSCVNGDTCTVCGEYVSADKGLHKYTKGNCVTNEACTVCGDIRKAAPGHSYTTATCTADAKCTRCGDIKQKAYGHSYTAHTCTSAKKCTRCGYQAAAALGHTTTYGICTRCNSEVFSSKYGRLSYYIYTEGLKSGNGVYYLKYAENISGSYVETKILYDINKTSYTIKSYIKSGNEEGYVTINIPKLSSSYSFSIDVYKAGKNLVPATGTINPSTTAYSYTYYNYTSNTDAYVEEMLDNLMVMAILSAEGILNDFHSSGLDAFGFDLY